MYYHNKFTPFENIRTQFERRIFYALSTNDVRLAEPNTD